MQKAKFKQGEMLYRLYPDKSYSIYRVQRVVHHKEYYKLTLFKKRESAFALEGSHKKPFANVHKYYTSKPLFIDVLYSDVQSK